MSGKQNKQNKKQQQIWTDTMKRQDCNATITKTNTRSLVHVVCAICGRHVSYANYLGLFASISEPLLDSFYVF